MLYRELNAMCHIERLVYCYSPSYNVTCRNIFFFQCGKKKGHWAGWTLEIISCPTLGVISWHQNKEVYAWQWMSFRLLCLNPCMLTKGPEGKTLCFRPLTRRCLWDKIQNTMCETCQWTLVLCRSRLQRQGTPPAHPAACLDEIRHAASHPDLISFCQHDPTSDFPPTPMLSRYNCRLWQYLESRRRGVWGWQLWTFSLAPRSYWNLQWLWSRCGGLDTQWNQLELWLNADKSWILQDVQG